MSNSLETKKVKEVLKTIIKRKGYSYQGLAKTLGVSEATVKRNLNQEDMTLRRLFKIMDVLGLDLTELSQLTEQFKKKEYIQYTLEQEEFLAEHPGHHHILYELMDGRSPEDLVQKFNLTKRSLQKYLTDLDQQNLIELHANNRVRLINRGVVSYIEKGPLVKKQAALRADMVRELTYSSTFTTEEDPNLYGDDQIGLLMRRETFNEFRKEQQALFKKYASISLLERAVEPYKDLLPIVNAAIITLCDGRAKILGMPKNFEE